LNLEQTGQELIERFFDRVFAYVRMRVPAQDCEDVVSDIFLRAIERRDQLRGNAAPWVFFIARSRIADYYRGRKEAHMTLDAAEGTVETAVKPRSLAGLERLEHAEFNERLRLCLNRLTEQERDVIALKFTDGLSNIEIAQLLNISPNSLGVILHRALKDLRAAMTKEI
jgi:RNA polymerase sigma-70 factor (ECF subfamily)